MNALAKFALGKMGRLRPKPALGASEALIQLQEPDLAGGLSLLAALSVRQSSREFAEKPLPLTLLSNLLWSAWGYNRDGKGRTAPSALNAQEIDLYVALPTGAYLYDAKEHALHLVAGADLRRVTGYQDFVDKAPLDLVLVANYGRMKLVPAQQRDSFASVLAGAIAQNIYLFCASAALATVIRAWIDRDAIADALGLDPDQHVLLSQTVGYPKQ